MQFVDHLSHILEALKGTIVSSLKIILTIVVLLLVMVSNTLDLVNDFAEKEPLWHLIEEVIVITMAFGLIAYLIVNLRQQKHHLENLKQELQSKHHSLEKSQSIIQNARKKYSDVIHQQFDDWHLSQSQQEIALLLLKGLTFNEIAAIRDTKEKTVRQQASEIYKKAGVAGRHAFSAWFFEDFL